MDVGTAEIVNEIEKVKKRRAGLFGGSNSGNGGGKRNGGGGDDGGDQSADDAEGRVEQFVPNKSRILTAFILLVVLMTFGGLIGAYIVLATNKAAEWKPF